MLHELIGDFAFRLGGDEFLLLFPAAGVDAASVTADRLRRLVDALT